VDSGESSREGKRVVWEPWDRSCVHYFRKAGAYPNEMTPHRENREKGNGGIASSPLHTERKVITERDRSREGIYLKLLEESQAVRLVDLAPTAFGQKEKNSREQNSGDG